MSKGYFLEVVSVKGFGVFDTDVKLHLILLIFTHNGKLSLWMYSKSSSTGAGVYFSHYRVAGGEKLDDLLFSFENLGINVLFSPFISH